VIETEVFSRNDNFICKKKCYLISRLVKNKYFKMLLSFSLFLLILLLLTWARENKNYIQNNLIDLSGLYNVNYYKVNLFSTLLEI
jgi:hypothetical protein